MRRPAERPFRDRTFLMVCATQLFGYFSNSMVIPLLPVFLAAQGHGEGFIGMVLAAFSAVSFPVRPLFGRLVDAGHLRRTLGIACLFLGIAPFSYLVPNSAALFVTRGLHGFGWGGLNTVGSAWIGLLAPAARRAEALGYYVLSQSAASAIAPSLGLYIAQHAGFPPAFVLAGSAGLCATVAAAATRQAGSTRGRAMGRRLSPADLIEPRTVPVSVLLALAQITQPAMSPYVPLYFRRLGLGGAEFYFLATGFASVAALMLLSRWQDRLGRGRAIGSGLLAQFCGILLMLAGDNAAVLVAGGMAYTLGYGVSQPSMYALAVDGSPPERRGSAMATYTMAFQFGAGVGSTMWGFVLEAFGYHAMYELALIPAAAAVVMLLVLRRKRPLPGEAG